MDGLLSKDSVTEVISIMEVSKDANFECDNNLISILVQVSQLRAKEEHKNKKFKILLGSNCVNIKRVL